MKALIDDTPSTLDDPEWPVFLIFPVPRGPDGNGFDIDLARKILHDEQMGFRLGYSVCFLNHYFIESVRGDEKGTFWFRNREHAEEIWKFLSLFDRVVFPSRNTNEREPFFQRLCHCMLHGMWDKKREPEVKEFLRRMNEGGKLSKEAERVKDTPFDKGVSKANKEFDLTTRKENDFVVIFGEDAWKELVREDEEGLATEGEIQQIFKKHGLNERGERISSGSGDYEAVEDAGTQE
ncbi:hypothetical protein B0T20DRAFT_409966 [Sordaria brevicollis]|uniref:Uncharacterized protein n=1 Tax=Sordaria brevicollis TaxID=83679 RepID=A0AAE0PG89_SORBR|nr:hypothetical protein B0T20DRAFT_409966 [Sordaria brevicollis]